ncbi:alcohol dehydrogenase catalytic domain-containing protein [Nocardioides cheoyonin]|uniref:alcohol dehydrogenase catalytic domain-containing protein n=1 Tax=Nocardioides cheoyonin TaxID=3156615 RepID=UPI0032B31A32
MRAVVMSETGGPSVLQLDEVADPEPGEFQVVIRVAACGICGHDQADRMGLTHIPLPAVLGHEVAGEVVAVGGKVRRFAVGDRVAIKQFSTCGACAACLSGDELRCPQKSFNYGGYAEFMAVDEAAVLGIPDDVGFADAAVVACTIGTCYQALTRIGDVRPGETVAVTGAGGGLGLHAIQVARSLGAIPIAVTSSPTKSDELIEIGAAHVVVGGKDAWHELLDLTDGHGVDVVLDNVGAPAVFSGCFRGLRHSGRYVFTGQVTSQPINLYPAFVFGKEATITGSASTLMSSFIASMELVKQKKIRPVTSTFALDDVVGAFAAVDERAVTGRAVLLPGGAA